MRWLKGTPQKSQTKTEEQFTRDWLNYYFIYSTDLYDIYNKKKRERKHQELSKHSSYQVVSIMRRSGDRRRAGKQARGAALPFSH